MWEINSNDISDVTLNVKNNYLLTLTGEQTQDLKIYNISDKKLIFETKTEEYLSRITSKNDIAYIVTSENKLLKFNLKTFEFENSVDLSLSYGKWSEENITAVHSLNDENYLLFGYSILFEDEDDYYEGSDLFEQILLYDIENNRCYPLCENDDQIQDFRVLNDNQIEFFDGEYLYKAEVDVNEKVLFVTNRINQEDETNCNLLNEINEYKIDIYEEKGLFSKAKLVLKDYDGNELFNQKTIYKTIRCYPILCEEQDLLILLITNQSSNFDIYTFNAKKGFVNLIKITHYDNISIDGALIFNYISDMGKVLLLERYNGAMLIDLEEII